MHKTEIFLFRQLKAKDACFKNSGIDEKQVIRKTNSGQCTWNEFEKKETVSSIAVLK